MRANYNDIIGHYTITGVTDDMYCKYTILYGNFHSIDDRPAIVYNDGEQTWYRHGKLHRDNDKPAVITTEVQKYYQHDELHRDNDKPAVIYANGTKLWYQHGKYIRNAARNLS